MKKSQKEGGERNILFSFPTVRRIPSIFVGAILQFFGVKIPTIHTLLKEKFKKCNYSNFLERFF